MSTETTILMTADTVGGVFSYSVDLARALALHGVRVAIATMGGPLSPAQRRAAAGLTVLESAFRLEWMEDPWEDVARAGEWLLGIEERLRPDVVHVNGLVHARLPFRAPTVAVVHSCVLSWWRAVHGEEAPERYERYRRHARVGLRAAGAVVAPTRAMLVEASRRHGPFGRAFVIPNAALASPRPRSEKEPFILAAGRLWDEGKNIAALGAVAAKLPWPVVVAGSDERPGGGRRPIPGVRSLGAIGRDDLAAWMSRAAIFAHPARYEPFGLSALEAALSGCALVLGDIPSLREVWADAAIFVPPGSPSELERALRVLVDEPSLRRRMALAASTRALAYSPERMARAYLGVYAGVRGAAPGWEAACV